jgi:hypothetical protein
VVAERRVVQQIRAPQELRVKPTQVVAVVGQGFHLEVLLPQEQAAPVS